ncbi:class I SAM-dependent methyltransferase [Paenibacillus montanisoli]|uniref:Class I SAM-dependent methyltransferase n=1 Tax=Paenibacillus montanisoli TaxID=2081970 RepID=A0A328TUJ4_9BACL|nr:class I SAM-dependent methyltransferase [Paenibacillus montanisoli]RAP74208.1 class I SAM-dependent methyltransferase [Paenibacillus montanisoli]
MSVDAYGKLCNEVYDFTKPVGHSIGGDLEFYLERLRTCRGRILEPMTGSGRFLVPLLEAGHVVDGVDASPYMLDACRKRLEERNLKADLYQMKLQELELPHRYDAIIVPTGSFLLIEKRSESIDVLKRFYSLLAPGGRVIIDLEMPHSPTFNFEQEWKSSYELPNGDTITHQGRTVEADLFDQYHVILSRYDKWRDGQLIQSEPERFAMRWYGVEEFRYVLQDIGFTEVIISADYVHGVMPTNSKQMFTYEAVKR